MKTIGIIGGMGPMAAVRLFERIVALTKAEGDNEHIPMIIDNNTNIPDRTAAILYNGENPSNQLVRSALRLELMGADFIIIACNTAHYYYDEIIRYVKIPVINMLEETVSYIKERHPEIRCAGLLATEGTCRSGIYERAFWKAGLKVVVPEPNEQKHITELIYGIKKGCENIDPSAANSVISQLEKRGAEAIVLGCTELPIAADRYNLRGNFIDSLEVLAEKAVLYAGKEISRPKKDSGIQ